MVDEKQLYKRYTRYVTYAVVYGCVGMFSLGAASTLFLLNVATSLPYIASSVVILSYAGLMYYANRARKVYTQYEEL